MTARRGIRLLLALALVCSACGREGGPGPGPSDAPPLPEPSSEVLRLGYANEPPTLDPLGVGGGSASTRDILRPILPALFSLDASLKPQPDLAAAWPSASDFTLDPFTVSVRLKGASWSDGRPITSKDVRYSWTKLVDGPTGYRYRDLRDVRTPADDRVVLEFERPVRRWWSLFGVDDMILPAHAYSDEWDAGPTVSGGPFRFETWTEGLQVRLVRNERYSGDAPPLAGIDVTFVPDDETRLQLLERGELDVAFAEGDINIGRRVNARDFAPKRGALDGSAGASNAFGPTWWELDLDPKALSTPVALAIVAATHPTLAAEIFEDSGLPMNGIPPDFTAADRSSAMPWRGRGSLSDAKGLLDKGGVRGGTRRAEFQLVYPSGTAGAIASYIHFRLDDIGLVAELVGLESKVVERSWVEGGRADAMLRLRRGADAPDAASYSSISNLPGAGPVDDDVADAEGDVSAERLTSGPVTGLSGAGWAEAQRKLAGAGSVAPLVQVRSWLIGREGVRGPHATGAANGPLWNAGTWSMTPAP